LTQHRQVQDGAGGEQLFFTDALKFTPKNGKVTVRGNIRFVDLHAGQVEIAFHTRTSSFSFAMCCIYSLIQWRPARVI
jgi:hypothetical protein